jgi:hypothetical protein
MSTSPTTTSSRDAAGVLESYLLAGGDSGEGDAFEWERVRADFFYVRIRTPSLYLGWLPVEIEIGERTLKLVAGFSIRPQTNEAEAYRYLLALNMKAPGFSFGLDAENRICLVGRIPLDDLDAEALDAAFGRVVEITESAVQSYLQLGFERA